ncbi:MAG: STAS domain-containing protein [Nitrosomonadales bacterium]
MEISIIRQQNSIIIAPQGRIDHTSSEDFLVQLEPLLLECKSDGPALILDFAGVEYISSVGLRALMLTERQIRSQKGRIAIAALTPMVLEVFQLSRFNLVYKIFNTVDEAVAGAK